MEMFEIDEKLQKTLVLFLEKILEHINAFTTKTIDIVLLPVEEYIQWESSKQIEEPADLELDIEAGLFETDDKIKEQLRQISNTIFKHSIGGGTNNNVTATLLPINLENISTTEKAFAVAQTPVKYNIPVSVTLCQQLEFIETGTENPKLGNTLVFTDCKNRLITCRKDGTDDNYMPQSNSPFFITEVYIDTVAISSDRIIFLTSISTGNVISTIKTSHSCLGLSYNDNKLYVLIKRSTIQVIDLAGKVIRDIPLPSDSISNITVHRDRLVCINNTSVYCCLLNGQIMWKFEDDQYKSFRLVTSDNEGNVYQTDFNTNTVVVVSDNGGHFREILTESEGMKYPFGIYFDKKDNVLLVSNFHLIKAFLFYVK